MGQNSGAGKSCSLFPCDFWFWSKETRRNFVLGLMVTVDFPGQQALWLVKGVRCVRYVFLFP